MFMLFLDPNLFYTCPISCVNEDELENIFWSRKRHDPALISNLTWQKSVIFYTNRRLIKCGSDWLWSQTLKVELGFNLFVTKKSVIINTNQLLKFRFAVIIISNFNNCTRQNIILWNMIQSSYHYLIMAWRLRFLCSWSILSIKRWLWLVWAVWPHRYLRYPDLYTMTFGQPQEVLNLI